MADPEFGDLSARTGLGGQEGSQTRADLDPYRSTLGPSRCDFGKEHGEQIGGEGGSSQSIDVADQQTASGLSGKELVEDRSREREGHIIGAARNRRAGVEDRQGPAGIDHPLRFCRARRGRGAHEQTLVDVCVPLFGLLRRRRRSAPPRSAGRAARPCGGTRCARRCMDARRWGGGSVGREGLTGLAAPFVALPWRRRP